MFLAIGIGLLFIAWFGCSTWEISMILTFVSILSFICWLLELQIKLDKDEDKKHKDDEK